MPLPGCLLFSFHPSLSLVEFVSRHTIYQLDLFTADSVKAIHMTLFHSLFLEPHLELPRLLQRVLQIFIDADTNEILAELAEVIRLLHL